jgi:hypothetical protein
MIGFETLIKQLEARDDLTPTEQARLAGLRARQVRLEQRVRTGEAALERRWLEEIDEYLQEERGEQWESAR